MKMTNKSQVVALLAMFLILAASYSCEKNEVDNDPVGNITTVDVSDISWNNAISGGVINDDESDILERGVCWSEIEEPTILDSKTSDGIGTGTFESQMTGLNENTTYYVRAYASNSTATIYGNEVSFITTSQPNMSFNALIDGVALNPTSLNYSSISGLFAISAYSGSKQLILWFPSTIITGNHEMGFMSDYFGQYSAGVGTDIFTSQSGSLNVSENNTSSGKLAGTFNFIGSDFTNTVSVTNGSFEIYR